MRPENDVVATDAALVSLQDVAVHYALGGSSLSRLVGRSSGSVRALDGVDLDVAPGEVVGLVGESGSGKSTLGRAVLGLAPVTGGRIEYRGEQISGLSESRMRPLRSKLQMIFQDPAAALNPSMTIEQAISDALRVQGVPAAERQSRTFAAMERVGLSPVERFAARYPSELSGGQKQRAVIARAISVGPELVVADEPISMLDMSVRAKILALLAELRSDLGISFVYITHDLASARFFCDRVAIMYLGRIVEIGPTEEIFAHPRHPYTQALLRAVPDVSHRRGDLVDLPRGEIPDAARPPAGCPFHPRCPQAFDKCGWEGRDLAPVLDTRWTETGLDTYRTESALVPDIAGTATVDGVATVRSPRPAQLLELVDTLRREQPDEPFFTGLRAAEVSGQRAVRLEFEPADRPELRPVGRSEVACHLY